MKLSLITFVVLAVTLDGQASAQLSPEFAAQLKATKMQIDAILQQFPSLLPLFDQMLQDISPLLSPTEQSMYTVTVIKTFKL